MTSRFDILRPYQRDAHTAVLREFDSGGTAALLHMVMGSGKTEVAFAIMESMQSALFLVSRVDLVQQTAMRYGDSCGVYCASLNQRTVRKITFASPKSLREVEGLPRFPLVVVDEAHRCTGDFRRLVEALQARGSKVLGLSATPWPVVGKGELFPRVTYEFGIKAALEQGFLVRPRMRGSQHAFDPREIAIKAGDFDLGALGRLVSGEAKVRAQIDEALELTRERKCLVWACVNIRHAELVARILTEKGETAVAFHSDLTMDERAARMAAFKQGAVRSLVFINIVAEGFDHPTIDTVVLMRPTRSPVLAIQTVGRSLRLAPGKGDALVLDYGRVFEAIGPLDAPILPKHGERKGEAYKLPPYKFCPGCYAYVEREQKSCPECNLIFVAPTAQSSVPIGFGKNLDARAMAGRLLSDEKSVAIERPVEKLLFRVYKAKSGRNVIEIRYVLLDMAVPLTEYITLGEMWMFAQARVKLARFQLDAKTVEQILKIPKVLETMKVPTPKSIKYTYREKYPEILEVIYETKRPYDERAAAPPFSA